MTPRDWDARWVPALAARAHRLVGGARAAAERFTGPSSVVGSGARAQPALAGSIAAVAAAAIVLAAAGGPGGPPDENPHGNALPPTPAPVTLSLGPSPGASVPAYLEQARANLAKFPAAARGRSGTALVAFSSYLTPAAARATVRDVQILRAYVRAPGDGLPTQVHAVALPGTFTSLEAGMQANGRLAAATGHTFSVLVSQLHPKTPQDVKLRDRYALQQRASSYEAQRLERPDTCSCVFAVVVQANADALTRLATVKGVRVVDVSRPGVRIDGVTVFPLEPEVTTLVPRSGLFGG